MKNFYLQYKAPIAAIMLLILGLGTYSLLNLKTGLFPDITFPKIKIIADNGDQPVDKMMVDITIPLENAIKKVEQLDVIRSVTSRGSCEISAFLNWGSDVELGKQRVEARINEIKQNLPAGVKISIEKMNPSIFPVMGYSIQGASRSLIELRQIAEYTIKPIISRVEGVSDVVVMGGKVKEYQILLDPIRMSNYGITPTEISNRLTETGFISSEGLVSDYNRLYLSLTDAAMRNISEIENTIIAASNKNIIRIKDIGDVEAAERRDYVKISADGQNVPLIAILKQPSANLIDVADKVNKQIADIHSVIPKDITLVPYYDQSKFVSKVTGSLTDVLWVGLILAIIVAFIFLGSAKASTVILITIPLTLSLTLVILKLFGYSLNIMTIGAIAAAIGLIIDDAIIVVEQIHRAHEENPGEKSSHLVNHAIKYLLPAMIGSSLSTIVIFFPFVLMGGVAGSYFKVMTDTMMITLASSFFIVLFCLPIIYILLSKEQHNIKEKSRKVKKRKWVYYFIYRPFYSIIFILILIAGSIFILPALPSGFLPEMDEGSIILDYVSPPGSSLEATDKMLTVVDSVLHDLPEIKNYSRRTGTQLGFFITEANDGDYLIELKDQRDKSTDEVSDKIRNKIEAVLPSLQIEFGQVIGDMLGDLMESVEPIQIKIFGDDQEKVRIMADSVAALIANVNGTADIFNGAVIAGPEIRFKPNEENLAKYNITPKEFQTQMQTKVEGVIVGGILEKNQNINIRMMESHTPPSLRELKKSSLFLPNGKLVPMQQFAEVNITKGISEISRENLKPMIAVTARLNQRDLGSTLNDIQRELSSILALPPGYQIVYGGEYEQQQKAFNELLIILIAAVLLVFTVILFLFRKILVAFAIIFISILGMAGCLFALYITGTPLNVGSYIGIIMIIGIIGENSIFTYLQYSEARKEGKDLKEALVFSISTRLRPKLMTALGAITALTPLALGIGTGAQMHQPLAIAIIGGMIIALPLLLITLPTVLKLIEK